MHQTLLTIFASVAVAALVTLATLGVGLIVRRQLADALAVAHSTEAAVREVHALVNSQRQVMEATITRQREQASRQEQVIARLEDTIARMHQRVEGGEAK